MHDVTRLFGPLTLLLISTIAQAQEPVISSVTVNNADTLQIEIVGQGLSNGSDAVVSLGAFGTLAVDSESPDGLVASAAMPVPEGDYVLTVTTSLGTVTYDLSVGTDFSETTSNTSIGLNALESITTGKNNSALGRSTLRNTTEGNFNDGFGAYALESNTTGFSNSASGNSALRINTTGINNTAIGINALG